MKTCHGCSRVLAMEQFYRHPRMADGHLGFCKDCVKGRINRARHENVEASRAADRRRRAAISHEVNAERRAKNAERLRRLLAEVPAQHRIPPPQPRLEDALSAREAVAYALRIGRLSRQPCVACGASRAHAHHPDYSRPLDVVWLCQLHHEAVHHAGAAEVANTVA